MEGLKALIFDVDGTLAETEELHRQAFNRTFQDFGLDWHWSVDTYRDLLKTAGGKERLRVWRDRVGARVSDATITELHKEKTGHYGRLMSEAGVRLRPGIADLMDFARKNGLKRAIATTTNRPNVDALCLAAFGRPAQDLFDTIAAGDEVPAKKPAPDVYLLALERLEVAAGEAIAFEDSRIGVLSAKAAGLRVIAAPSLYTTSDRLDEADLTAPALSLELVREASAFFSGAFSG
ncbi:HAD-IA family hydrolase [Roseibium aggregatum]|uniref:HAD-IA family hydrolase n=1 Tax=Roseibium aggregatum TaxID=187304 RepID=UPI002E2A678F|nr:HAD-IA family hydrolase [Roseibium aggregatum]